jgi:hypothetical protein
VYAENMDGKRRFIAKARADRGGNGLFDLYADKCDDEEQVVICEIEESEIQYTVIINGQDGIWQKASSIQAAKSAARKMAKSYGQSARRALVRMVDEDGQESVIAELASDGYNWAGRGSWFAH